MKKISSKKTKYNDTACTYNLYKLLIENVVRRNLLRRNYIGLKVMSHVFWK
jgi:hypothetical protein